MFDFWFADILNFIGGTIRWFVVKCIRVLLQKPPSKYSFKEYIHGAKRGDNWEKLAHGLNNSGIAIVFLIAIIYLVIYS